MAGAGSAQIIIGKMNARDIESGIHDASTALGAKEAKDAVRLVFVKEAEAVDKSIAQIIGSTAA
ncbi:MAG: hypothetical protein Q9221_003127, partial [Calogaya cf. arnoldii]